ncbi:cation:proton antiporter [Amniculibacterium sp. G2-70]|uniref:cation:proton antiporter n=1 Tax=Amniculibacterium sp. G2-70 TaxID=2767188 RepID=UPI0016543A94|nr:cation:proton antiporter [Amniculibacterium sp. G2-70]
MIFLSINSLSLPIEDPVLKFLLVLVIILSAPLLLNKIKVPHLLGLIIAGAIIGPNGFNVLSRDSSIVVSGTTGLLYIMFLAGLEIDMGDFKKNKWKSITFGLYTFSIPLILGVLLAHFVLGFTMLSSFIFASIFSTHTLISYPIIGKLGLVKNRVVNIVVGGTMITDVLALLILAIVVGITQGEVNAAFWTKLIISFSLFSVIVLFLFPIISRWFFKKVNDKISQYIFVLVMIYLAALLAELAGLEAIIGAFFAGLALNKLIPHTSALMNRVEFVGNAIFIPFFLISVGMLIDFKVFLKDFETIKVIVLMTSVAVLSKYLAAAFTQKTFNFTKLEKNLIFGLSVSHAAATLAVVMVGYNIIIGENELGEPIRLLNESVLNGSIVLILISCTLSSFSTQATGEKLVLEDSEESLTEDYQLEESILLPINQEEIVEPMVNLALALKSKLNIDQVHALNIINDSETAGSEKKSDKILGSAVNIAASTDIKMQSLKRYDNEVMKAINNVIKELKVSDVIFGLETKKGFSPTFIYNLYNSKINENNTNIFIYHAAQPMATIKKYAVIIPPKSQHDSGFYHALVRLWNMAKNSGSKMNFITTEKIAEILKKILNKSNIECEFTIVEDWKSIENIIQNINNNEGFIAFMKQSKAASYISSVNDIPRMMNQYLMDKNYLLIYPYNDNSSFAENKFVSNHDDYYKIGEIIGKLFKA